MTCHFGQCDTLWVGLWDFPLESRLGNFTHWNRLGNFSFWKHCDHWNWQCCNPWSRKLDWSKLADRKYHQSSKRRRYRFQGSHILTIHVNVVLFICTNMAWTECGIVLHLILIVQDSNATMQFLTHTHTYMLSYLFCFIFVFIMS